MKNYTGFGPHGRTLLFSQGNFPIMGIRHRINSQNEKYNYKLYQLLLSTTTKTGDKMLYDVIVS